MDAGSDDDDEAGLAEQQRDLLQRVGQAQMVLTRARAELQQATLMQQQ
jgi:hypothetical protein